MFITDGFNVRNTEFGAVIGLSQLPRLDGIIKRRREVCDRFISIIKKHKNIFHGISTWIYEYRPGNKTICVVFDEESECSGPRR